MLFRSRHRRVTRTSTLPERTTSVITIPAAVMNDAARHYLFTNVDISKRWQVHIRRGDAMRHVIALILLGLFEAGYFETKNVLTWRAVSGLLRRWPEALDYGKVAFYLATGNQAGVTRIVTDPA